VTASRVRVQKCKGTQGLSKCCDRKSTPQKKIQEEGVLWGGGGRCKKSNVAERRTQKKRQKTVGKNR